MSIAKELFKVASELEDEKSFIASKTSKIDTNKILKEIKNFVDNEVAIKGNVIYVENPMDGDNVMAYLEDEKIKNMKVKLAAITAQKKKKKNGDDEDVGDEDTDEKLYNIVKKYRQLLVKMLKIEAFNKLKFIIDNKRLRKTDRWWLMAIDKGQGAGSVGDIQDWQKQLTFIFRNKLPVARILTKILDYGLENGYTALKRMLENDRARIIILKEEDDGK